MVKLSARLLLLTALVSTFFLLRPAVGRILLKPTGENAFELRTKSVAAEVVIDRQFATTTLTMTFLNETTRSTEADFFYTLPPDTVVTYFAYWYDQDKVVARIVEKEEAADIYRRLTTVGTDPALVELTGRNSFRARIAPIFPNSDLRVEMILVQVLPSDQQGFSYELPLREEKGRELASVNVNVLVKPQASIERVTNNYGLPVTQNEKGYHLTLTGAKFRPPKDLRVQVIRKPQPLHAELYAAPSGGADGFFVLALTPDHSLTKPKVSFSGMTTYQVLPSNMPNVKAFHALTLVGRYKGSGPATVHFTGGSPTGKLTYTQPVTFGAEAVPNNLATKLWAARRMDYLSKSSRNRKAVLALSHRFTLPSKFSSWLAVPKAERRAMEQARFEVRVERLGRLIAQEVAEGRPNGARIRRLRQQLDELCSGPRLGWRGYLYQAFRDQTEELARDIAKEEQRPKPNRSRLAALRLQMQRLLDERSRQFHEQPRSIAAYVWEASQEIAEDEISSILNDLGREVVEGRDSGTKARQLRRQLKTLSEKVNGSFQSFLEGHFYWVLDNLAYHLVREEHGGDMEMRLDYQTMDYQPELRGPLLEPDLQRVAEIRLRIERVERATGLSAAEHIKRYEEPWKFFEIKQLREKLLAELRKEQPETDSLRQIEQQFTALNREVRDENYATARMERLKARVELEKLDKAQLPEAEREARRAKLIQREQELRARMGDPLISIEAPADARQVVALMPTGEVKPLVLNSVTGKWEARFDIPTYLTEGEYTITIIIVLKDGTRKVMTIRYHVDLTPPSGVAQATVVSPQQPTLRLEIEATEDTARVTALLPWGSRVALEPSSQPHRFFALVPVPPAYQGKALSVTYLLLDRAHNRTTVTVTAQQ